VVPGRESSPVDSFLAVAIAAALLGGAAIATSSRAAQVVVFAAMLAALWGVGSRLARWLVPDFGSLSLRVFAFVFAVGAAVVPATWLGHFGLLRPAPFLLWTAAAFLLTRFLPENASTAETQSASQPAAEAPQRPAIAGRVEIALLGAAAAAIALAGLLDVHGLLYEPPRGFDDVSYHLSAVATWIRHGDLRMIRFAYGDPSTSFYPVLGEMASWVLIVPFRDCDVAARWSQIPFALFSFLAVAALARRLGLSPRFAALAAIAYAGIHEIFPVLAMGAGNDHSTSFFTLAALEGSLAFAQRPRAGAAVAAGAALGLLLATKYIGFLFAPVLLAVLLLALLIERRRKGEGEIRPDPPNPPKKERVVRLLALLALTVMITGGYTYLRNAVTTGNPIYPAPVHLFGREILSGSSGVLPGARGREADAQIDVVRFLARRPDLFGRSFPVTLLPAALLAPLLALLRRRWREALVFSLPAVFFLQFLYLMFDHRGIRYFLPALALAAVAFAWLLAQKPRWLLLAGVVVLGGILWQELEPRGWTGGKSVSTVLVVLLLGALLELAWRSWQARRSKSDSRWLGRRGRVALAGAVVLVVALAAAPLGRTVTRYQERKLKNQPAAQALEDLAGPDGARVAYAGFNQPYFFFGRGFQNDLGIVPRNRALAAQYYRWRGEVANPYLGGPYRRWRGNLETLGIEYLVVARTEEADPEHHWATRRTNDFVLVYEDADTWIWRFVPEKGGLPAL
jgi:hypothetical protein